MRFILGIVLYYPDLDILDKIKGYSEVFNKIIAFDNSEKNHGIQLEIDKLNLVNVMYISRNNNYGLSYAYNFLLEKSQDYDYLCILDQDSIFEINDILKMKQLIETCNLNKPAIIAPIIDYGYKKILRDNIIEKCRYVISSGSFINIKSFKDNDIRFDENYFIDRVDVDICQQCLRNGLKIYKYHNSVLHQKLGDEIKFRHSSHNKLRHYYIMRNRLYYNYKYNNKNKALVLSLLQTLKQVFLIVLFENDKLNKLKMLKTAINDFFNNNMGKKEINTSECR